MAGCSCESAPPVGIVTHGVRTREVSRGRPTRTPARENAAASAGLIQGRNFKGQSGYAGPEAKKGNTHHFYFQVFALDQKLDLPPGATRQELGKALERGAIAKGKLVATYTR